MRQENRNHQVAQHFRLQLPFALKAEAKPPQGRLLRDVEETLIECPNDRRPISVLYEDLIEGMQYPVGGKCQECGWRPDLAEVMREAVQ